MIERRPAAASSAVHPDWYADAVFGNPRPTNRALREGDVIVNEIGAWYQSVSAQAGNPIVCGRPTPLVDGFFLEVVQPGFEALKALLTPGQPLGNIHARAGQFFRDKGHQSRPLHIHHINVCTAGPSVGPGGVSHQAFDATLQPGMKVMLEPCPITAHGRLGLFLGRTFVITDDGHEPMTNMPVELIMVGTS